MYIHTITDLQAPELQPYRTLRRSQEQYDRGFFIAEGARVVSRLLESRITVRSLLLTDEWFRQKRAQIGSLIQSPEVYVGSKETLAAIVGYNLHQGIMGLAEVPAEITVADLVRQARQPRLLVAIDDLRNAENVGVIVRNARAFGADGILVGETSSSPYLRRAVRNSLGTVFSLPIVHTPDLAGTIRKLSSESGMLVLAAETRKDGSAIDTTDCTGDICIVFGSEDDGLRRSVLEECDRIVEVPMVEGMDSINVANATAVCLYEVRRQRRL